MRKGSWTIEEDRLLSQTVLSHIRQKKTQLSAFDEASKRLGRSPSACSFRWNGVLREKYKEDITMAIKIRNDKGDETPLQQKATGNHQVVASPLEKAISLLLQFESQNNERLLELQTLKAENSVLKGKLKELEKKHTAVEEEHKEFLDLLHRAKKREKLKEGNDHSAQG